MNRRSVILLGVLAALLLIFFCIFFNAERYYKELALGVESKKSLSVESSVAHHEEEQEYIGTLPMDEILMETEVEEQKAIVAERSEKRARLKRKEESSSFYYYTKRNRSYISGKIPLLDNGDIFKKFIADCSKNGLCENSVTFFDYDESISWKDFASSILTLFMEEKILNPRLSIEKKNITIEGEFETQSAKDKLLGLVREYRSSFLISDMTSVKKVIKEEPIRDETLKKLEREENLSSKRSIKSLEEEQAKISELLHDSKINFEKNSGTITPESKKVLDRVVKLLKGKEDILIEVQGHTDAGGKEKVNLWISQLRANGVKKYLIQNGIKAESIRAKGYGETQLLLATTPYDPSNRRVEIHLKRK